MKEWEYNIVTIYHHNSVGDNITDTDLAERLNILGNDGWELVSTHEYNSATKLYFKRPKSN